jgi:hypothetical protein
MGSPDLSVKNRIFQIKHKKGKEMKKLLLALLSTLAFPMVNAATLFDNGKTDWQIVIPVKADAAEKYAAAELQTALKKISGAEFPIVSSDQVNPRQIIIGSLPTAPAVQKQINALKLKKSKVLLTDTNLNVVGDNLHQHKALLTVTKQ